MTAYEQLRRHIVTGLPADQPWRMGWVVLARKGVAAWMTHCRSEPPPAKSAAAAAQNDGRRLASDELGVAMVRVLAAMALASRKERAQ